MARHHNTKYHRVWRAKVKKRGGYKCDISGIKTNLYAHHLNDVTHHWNQRKHVRNGVLTTRKLHTIFHCQYMGGFAEKCTAEDYNKFKKDIVPNLHLFRSLELI